MRNSDGMVRNNICRISNDRAKKLFPFMKQGDKYMDLPKEIREILPFREDIFHDRLKRLDMNRPSWTVLAHIGMDGYMYIHPIENRTLSVREAARLQGFHDSFIFIGNMREQYIQGRECSASSFSTTHWCLYQKIIRVRTNMISFADVFSGCGGLSQGFYRHNSFDGILATDSWEKAGKVFSYNHPEISFELMDLFDPSQVEFTSQKTKR